jgi:hypothetical protein
MEGNTGGKINFTKKENPIHKEAIMRVFNIEGKRIPFAHQETSANCGPLAITNGVNALAGVNEKFIVPKDFPISSEGIRKLLAGDENLRSSYLGIESSDEIKKDNYALKGEHIKNIIDKLAREANLRISVNRFGEAGRVNPEDFNERVLGSDWLILHKGYHYKSFVKLDNTRWISVDSMNTEPILIDVKNIEKDFQTVTGKDGQIPIYMAMKVAENKPIIFTKKS